MNYRQLGRTGIYVSEICLGTMTWGGQGFWKSIGELQLDGVEKHLRTAFDAGVNFIDTANVYHEGLSEELLGQALARIGRPRHEVVVATKVRGRMGDSPNAVGLTRSHILHQVDESLKRLDLDYIDLYQVHGVDPLTPIEVTLRVLDDLVRSGRVRHLGVSNFAAWQIMKALGTSDKLGLDRFESAQMYYSLATRDIEDEVAPLCLSEGLGILAWSPLSGGLLTGKFTRAGGPDGARRTAFDFPPVDTEHVWPVIDVLKDIAADHDCSVARVAVAWVLSRPAIASVIIGARTESQLQDNLAAADLDLGEDELLRLEKVSAVFKRYPGWMIEFQGANRLLPPE